MSESETPEEQAAAQLEASGRRMVASWAGDPLVTQLVSALRPDARALLDQLGIDAADDKFPAAARILGLGLTAPDGTELPNLFAAWPPERRAAAGLVASGVRTGLAEMVTKLRSDGVRSLPAIEHITRDDDTPDGLQFRPDHVALLLLLWIDVSLDGRSGAEIAADLPMLGAVGWERTRSVLLIGSASQPDILAGDTLRRAYVRRSEGGKAPEPTDDTSAMYRFADPEFRLAHPLPESEPPSRRIDRYRLPGWSDLAEILYLAKHPPRRPLRRAGRPKGPYLIQTRAEIENAYRELWTKQGRRPYWSQVARALNVDERTLRRVRRDFGLDKQAINQTPE